MKSLPDVQRLLHELDGKSADALESGTIEFKSWDPDGDPKKQLSRIREAVVAFANADGGVVVLGVADRKRTRAQAIHGVGKLEANDVRRSIYDGTSPPILVDIEEHRESEGRVLAIRVPRGVPPHTTTEGVGRIRVGKESKPLTGSSLTQLLIGSAGLDMTAEPVAEADPSSLDSDAFDELRRTISGAGRGKRLEGLPDRELLEALGLAEGNRVSLAAVLLLGTPAAIARFAPRHELIFTKATSSSGYKARRDLRGPLLRTLEQAVHLVAAHSGLTTVPVSGLRHIEVPDVTSSAVREAILNALTHRDYFVNQSIHVTLRPDGLEVDSPGGLPPGVTPDNILRHQPVRRNPLLANVFHTIGLVERAGLGVDRLHEELLRSGKHPPRYEAEPTFVRLTLPTRTNKRFAAFVENEHIEGRELSLDDLLLLEALTRESSLDRWSAARVLQLSDEAAAARLIQLRTRGLVAPLGRGRGTKYQLAGSLAPVLPLTESDPETDQGTRVLDALARRGRLRRSDVRRLTGLSLSAVRRLLEALRRDGLIVLRGERRGAHYVLGPAAAVSEARNGSDAHKYE